MRSDPWRGARRAGIVAALAWAAGIAGCGGGAEVRDTDPPAARAMLQGVVYDTRPAPFGRQIEVKALTGPVTTLRRTTTGFYDLPVDHLGGPFVLLDRSVQLAGLALGPGTAHVTPLSHLLLAELQGEEPLAYFEALGPVGGADHARITPAGVADAEARLRQRLQRQLGVRLPDGLGSVIDAAFVPGDGDAMTALIGTLQAALQDQGLTLADLATAMAEHGRQCEAARVDLAGADGPQAFCPAQRATGPDADDASISVLRFDDTLGDTLVVRLQGDQVLGIALQRGGAPLAACDDAACTGVQLGEPDAAGARTLRFEGTPLTGDGGAFTLAGTLASGQGGVGAACSGRRITLHRADGTEEQDCVGQRQAARHFGQLAYAFIGKADPTRVLDVRVDGDTVAWVAWTRIDGTVDYRCAGAECTGVELGAPDAQGIRRVRLQGTPLVRSLGAGQLDPADTATVDAELLTARAPAPLTSNCPVTVSLQFASSDGPQLPMCDLRPGGSIGADDRDGDGRTETIFTSSTNAANDTLSLHFDVDRGAAVEVTLQRGYLQGTEFAYRCQAEACQGMSVSRTTDLRFLFRFDGTVLQELLPDGAPGPRTLTLQGTVLSGALVSFPRD